MNRLALLFVVAQVALPAIVQCGRLFFDWETVRFGWLMFSLAP